MRAYSERLDDEMVVGEEAHALAAGEDEELKHAPAARCVGVAEQHEHLLRRHDEDRQPAHRLVDRVLVNAVLVEPNVWLALMLQHEAAAHPLQRRPLGLGVVGPTV